MQRLIMFALTLALVSCGDAPDDQVELYGVTVECDTECPAVPELVEVFEATAADLDDHVRRYPFDSWHGWTIVMRDQRRWGSPESSYLAPAPRSWRDQEILGMTIHQRSLIEVHRPNWKRALPWELTLVALEDELGPVGEAAKIDWYNTHLEPDL